MNLLFAVFLVFSFLYFGISYFTKKIQVSSAEIVEDKKTIYALNAKNSQLDNYTKKYQEVEADTNQALAAVVDDDKVVDFITELEKTAQDNKVKMKIQATGDDKSDKQQNDSFITSSSFKLTVGGGFDSLMHFLYNVENFRYANDIENVRIAKGDFDQYNKDILVLSFDLKLYQKNS